MNINLANATNYYPNITNLTNTQFREKDLIVGVHLPDVGLQCSTSLKRFLNCNLITVQVALHWMNLLAPPSGIVTVKIYENDQFQKLFKDLEYGFIDMVPMELLAIQSLGPYIRYHETYSGRSTEYFLYNGLNMDASESPVEFLIAPFKPTVWIVVATCCVWIFIMEQYLGVRKAFGSVYSRVFLSMILLALSFFSVVYSSQLKALLTTHSTGIPFRNLYELANLIEDGSKIMVVEDKDTMRWRLLKKHDQERTDPIDALYQAIKTRGSTSIIHQPNISEICKLLTKSQTYVYFADEDMVLEHCGRLCVWKYRVVEYPDTPIVLPISKHNRPLMQKADVLGQALINYRLTLYNRRYGDECSNAIKTEADFIGMKSLSGAAILLTVGLLISILMLGFERLWSSDSRACCR